MRNTPVVLGVLSIAFGSLQALFSAMGLASQPLSKNILGGMGKAMSGLPGAKQPGQPDPAAMMEGMVKLTDELKPYTLLLGISMIILASALVVVGVLLYKRRARARPLALIWAVAALAYIPFQLYVQVAIVQPRTAEIMRQMMPANQPASAAMDMVTGMQGGIVVVTTLLFYTPFPILLLILMGRPKIKQVLEPAPAPAAPVTGAPAGG
jgi:hypothetical protein